MLQMSHSFEIRWLLVKQFGQIHHTIYFAAVRSKLPPYSKSIVKGC